MPLLRPMLQKINSGEVLRYAGVREAGALPEELVQYACREALLYARPAGSWEIYAYDGQRLLAEKSFAPASKDLAAHLVGATRVAVLAVTIGPEIEERISGLFAAGRGAQALLLDAAATTAVEQAADSVSSFIAAGAGREGLTAGVRFSPGYGDWPLEEQAAVLPLSGGEALGLILSSAFMLQPRKSITAVLPLYTRGKETGRDAACTACEQDNCQFRREK